MGLLTTKTPRRIAILERAKGNNHSRVSLWILTSATTKQMPLTSRKPPTLSFLGQPSARRTRKSSKNTRPSTKRTTMSLRSHSSRHVAVGDYRPPRGIDAQGSHFARHRPRPVLERHHQGTPTYRRQLQLLSQRLRRSRQRQCRRPCRTRRPVAPRRPVPVQDRRDRSYRLGVDVDREGISSKA